MVPVLPLQTHQGVNHGVFTEDVESNRVVHTDFIRKHMDLDIKAAVIFADFHNENYFILGGDHARGFFQEKTDGAHQRWKYDTSATFSEEFLQRWRSSYSMRN